MIDLCKDVITSCRETDLFSKSILNGGAFEA
jgi:hypothetical protein